MIDFAHNSHAKLLPLLRSLFYFSCHANRQLFAYGSRTGSLVSYTGTLAALRRLADHEAEETIRLGQDENLWLIGRMDNIQKMLRQREIRFGRADKMLTGTHATFMEAVDYRPEASDLADKQRRLAANERQHVTVDKLLDLINQPLLERIATLDWLRTLVRYVPQLSKMKDAVNAAYKRETSGHRPAKAQKTKIHPLGCNNFNENNTAELLKCVNDMLRQVGQTERNHIARLLLIGGDGLTYERLVQLKRYMQMHPGEFQSLGILEPFLELWHTAWTDLSRIYEAHWGNERDAGDVSTLGHSATVINRKKPSNLKKVDYYPHSELAYLVLDCRMLDCWR